MYIPIIAVQKCCLLLHMRDLSRKGRAMVEKFICAQRESCYLQCFHRGMQFFMLLWNYVPLQFNAFACCPGWDFKIYLSRLTPLLPSAGESFSINQDEMGNMLIENAGIAMKAIK
jgi:hypothetical protein